MPGGETFLPSGFSFCSLSFPLFSVLVDSSWKSTRETSTKRGRRRGRLFFFFPPCADIDGLAHSQRILSMPVGVRHSGDPPGEERKKERDAHASLVPTAIFPRNFSLFVLSNEQEEEEAFQCPHLAATEHKRERGMTRKKRKEILP